MTGNEHERAAVVTGASSGIGDSRPKPLAIK
jgi:short-subunit dehydrogenase